jgi:hypothetical protein
MAFITMWQRGDLKCVFVVATGTPQPYRLCLIEGDAVLRTKSVKSPDDAVRVSNIWQAQDPETLRDVPSAGRTTVGNFFAPIVKRSRSLRASY